MKCKHCGHIPQRKINRQPLALPDETGIIKVVDPPQMINYAYYECSCGMRFTPKEMGEPRETWERERK